MKQEALFFTAPEKVEIRERELAAPCPGKALVRTRLSAVSPGSEMLIYRGLAPDGLLADDVIPSLNRKLEFPISYGYAAVGEVLAAGADVSPDWVGRTVFSFQPHASCFSAGPEEMIPVPRDIAPEDAVMLPFLETALSFVMDGRVIIGERVVVFGQGIIGLLTSALIAMHPVAALLALDRYPLRRRFSLGMGAHACFDPGEVEAIQEFLPGGEKKGADLVFELSGNPDALNQAISLVGYGGRILIGSWYGKKRAALDLGGRFHRDRIALIGSQVGSLDPALRGRWDKARRFELAWGMIRKIRPARCITHRFPFERAPEAYDLLDRHPGECLQIVFTYPG
jgi:2-desacetyl-2-hydroxyethyl bacteriochlorophyllide A dehydrogenase